MVGFVKMKHRIKKYWESKQINITPNQFLWGFFALVLLSIVSRNLLKYGVGHSKIRDVCLMLVLLITLSSSRKVLKFVVTPFVILMSLYIPIGYSFGAISENYLMALYATDTSELFGMLTVFSKTALGLAVVNIGLYLVYVRICLKKNINLYRNKMLIVLVALIGLSNQLPFAFFTNAYHSAGLVQVEIEKMEKFSQQSNQDTWGMVTQHQEQSQYDDYVVVIGESVRKDYLHLYGYPVANTPFLSHVNGTFIDGLKSADRYTIPSLTRMLTKTDPKNQTAQYDKNIVSLANKAGFETHWLSNQGSFGKDDTPIAAIARQAHERTFLKHGSYDIALISDMELLGLLKQKLQIPSVKKRLFFIHTVGSHPDACQQIQDFTSGIAVKNASYKGVECYVNSIHKTDVFLQKIYSELRSNEQKSRRSFSMLYFADHGLVAVEEEGKFKLVHGESLQSSDVPLVKISSDDQERKRITSAKSGYYFADGLARWLGISGAELTQYDLFSDEETEQVVFPVFQKSFDNPAIDITDK